MDDYDFLPVHITQHSGHGNPSAHRHVRRILRQSHGTSRRVTVHYLVHSLALPLRVPRRQDADHGAVPGDCCFNRFFQS